MCVQSDYCIRVDGQWTIDGAERAADTASFSACHMNHGPSAARNVVRQTLRRERRVVFYACRDIPVSPPLLVVLLYTADWRCYSHMCDDTEYLVHGLQLYLSAGKQAA